MIYVDVKTFLSFRIETDDLQVAETEAKRFLEALNACPAFIDGWNDVQRKEGGPIIAHVGNSILKSLPTSKMKTETIFIPKTASSGVDELDYLTNPKFADVVKHYEEATRASRLHSLEANRALALYGDHGAPISGCVREHFPSPVKDTLRLLARKVSEELDLARAARPKYVRKSTIYLIGRLVATRDGAGFYGPQSYPTEK